VRSLILFVVIIVACVAIRADDSDPFLYVSELQWSSAVQPFGQGWLTHQSRTAWSSSDPVLTISDRRGKVLHGALNGNDIRAVTTWRDRVIAVRRDGSTHDVLLLDRTLRTIDSVRLLTTDPMSTDRSVTVIADDRHSRVFVKIGGSVIALDADRRPLSPILIEEGVRGIGRIGTGSDAVALVHDVGGVAFVAVIDTLFQRRIAPSVPLAPWSRVTQVDGEIAVLSPIDRARGTQITVVDPATSTTRTLHVGTAIDLLHIFDVHGEHQLARVELVDGKFSLRVGPIDADREAQATTILPGEFGSPLRVTVVHDTIYIVFSGGLVTATADGSILSRDALSMSGDPSHLMLQRWDVGILISSNNHALFLRRYERPTWWIIKAFRTAGAFFVPAILLLVIAYLLLRLRRQRRFLDAMLELPGAGLVFVIDAAGRLRRTNERGASLLRISSRVPMGRSFHAYVQHRGVEGVRWFLEQAYADRRPMSEKASIDDGDEQREYVFTAAPLFGTLGRLRGIVVTGVDITEALEKRRLVNWAQLAHDMQTNLSTIRLNAEQLATSRKARPDGVDDRRTADEGERVKRILFQTRVLMQRVRDLVSVGRSEELVRAPVHSAEFCTEIMHEFDPEMFPYVSFSMKLRGTMMNVDRLKLSRAVRNAVENAIKSLRGQEGTVEISTWFDRSNVYIRISDTGVGMDTLTLENMMKPYFTTSKDGSGTGIGTMIMQHVTHLHGGALRVTSEPGQGTQVVFRIPHLMDGWKGATARADEAIAV
jgi:signal transduction histidine kinase